MVDMTEQICQKLDSHLAAMTIFDTSGIEALLPVLVDFFQKHPLIAPKTFLGDAAFDTIEICKSLFGEIGFEKAFISLRVNFLWTITVIPSTKMVFPVVRIFLRFL